MSGALHVLGPQRPEPNVLRVLPTLPADGPLVMISAGWRIDETDAPAVMRRLGVPVVHLPLYDWFEEVRERAPALEAAWRARQADILAFKQVYHTRMRHLLDAARAVAAVTDLTSREGRVELDDAIADVRRLDARVIERTAQIIGCHPETHHTWEHPAVRAWHEQAAEVIGGARAVLVAGGHVGVLRSRLWFFGLHRLLPRAHAGGTSIIAWSAGAMALAPRIVLFYDDPPEGPSWPELLDHGMDLLPDAVFLPHARQRLRLDDRTRVALLAARFGPEPCLGLERGAWLTREDGQWRSRGPEDSVIHLRSDGHVAPWGGAHAP
ncbi:MAG TPA: Type 1 glutamine amidotransferase-like domain-containing protein [Myxococcota bacterium]|nr:Type 1 glutamine amidotransferase-like domain-containing protein [Myxococcota bacterium]